jgi:ribosomal protein L16 Arg81 hydroxylase
MERQRALSAGSGGIPRVRGLSSQDFLDLHYAPGRPVVIEGEMDDWPALARWTPAHLRAAIGAAPVEYQAARDSNPDFELDKDAHRKTLPFDAWLDLIEAGGNDAYITAYNSAANAAALAPLQRDLGFLDKYLTRDHGMMWIGPAGTFTPLHFDLTNNLLAQIVGRKRAILLPPSETPRLQHNRHVFSDVHDIEDESRLAKFPAARGARRFVVDLGPGDLLYVPIGWWHQVRSHEFSVTLTYTNFLWPNEGHESYPPDAR